MADGITVEMLAFLEDSIGPVYSSRLISAQNLIFDYISHRTPAELEIETEASQRTWYILRRAFSNEVITPGKTRLMDIYGFILQEWQSQDLAFNFAPGVTIYRRGIQGGIDDTDNPVVEPGDLLHVDFGVRLMGLVTDQQHVAYVLYPDETEPPAGLQALFKQSVITGNIYAEELKAGQVGTVVKTTIEERSRLEGIQASVYGHTQGNWVHGAGARAVAEAAMSCMLAMSKRLGYWHGRMVAGDWQSRYDTQNDDLDGATLGSGGCGRIGRLVAAMAAPFDMRILAHDPFVTADMLERDDAAPQVELVSLEAIFEKSDYITVHAAMSEENQGLIDLALLSRCKRGAYFVNLARGGILESLDIVCEALEEGRLAGVALDVFEPEPPDFGHPIFARDDCITAPHALAMSHGAMRRIFTSMTNDVEAILEGRPPQFVVNPEVLTA